MGEQVELNKIFPPDIWKSSESSVDTGDKTNLLKRFIDNDIKQKKSEYIIRVILFVLVIIMSVGTTLITVKISGLYTMLRKHCIENVYDKTFVV